MYGVCSSSRGKLPLQSLSVLWCGVMHLAQASSQQTWFSASPLQCLLNVSAPKKVETAMMSPHRLQGRSNAVTMGQLLEGTSAFLTVGSWLVLAEFEEGVGPLAEIMVFCVGGHHCCQTLPGQRALITREALENFFLPLEVVVSCDISVPD